MFGGASIPTEADLSAHLTPPVDDSDALLQTDVTLLLSGQDGKLVMLPKRDFYTPGENRRRNQLIIGQIGSGKTYCHIWPSVLSTIENNPDHSIVFVDTKGDAFEVISEFVAVHRPGTKVLCLNLSNASRSVGWNPFAGHTSKSQIMDDMEIICHAAERQFSNRTASSGLRRAFGSGRRLVK
jgi:hypothetical protein